MAEFDAVADAVESATYIDRWHARKLYDHVRASGARRVLELGTAHGGSAAYLAAAVQANGGGRVITVDRNAFAEPAPEETLAKAGMSDLVELVRVPESSYTWWLADRIEDGTEPFDFCLLDGAHDWHIDGLSVVLIERLLKHGAWLALDDLDWTYERIPEEWHPPHLSERELRAPQVQVVFDHVVKPHPHFTELRVEDGVWGWARKAPGAPKSLVIQETVERKSILQQRVERAAQRALSAARKRASRR